MIRHSRQYYVHSWCFKNTNWERTNAFETLRQFHMVVDKVLIVIGLLHKGASVVCIPHFSPSGLPAICCCNNPYFKNCKLTVLLSNISFVSKGSVQESIEAENYDQERGLFAQKLWKIVIIFSFKERREGGGGEAMLWCAAQPPKYLETFWRWRRLIMSTVKIPHIIGHCLFLPAWLSFFIEYSMIEQYMLRLTLMCTTW